MSDTCPKCGAKVRNVDYDTYFACGSMAEPLDGKFIQGKRCRIRQLEAENAALRERCERAEGALKEREAEEGDWYVTNHDRNDETVRGPYKHSETAGLARHMLEDSSDYWSRQNLWIVQRRDDAATKEGEGE